MGQNHSHSCCDSCHHNGVSLSQARRCNASPLVCDWVVKVPPAHNQDCTGQTGTLHSSLEWQSQCQCCMLSPLCLCHHPLTPLGSLTMLSHTQPPSPMSSMTL